MARKPDVQLADRRRAQIRDAARACFRRLGFHKTGMAEIIAEAKTTPGTLYRYYGSKADIIRAIVEEDLQRDAQDFAALAQVDDLIAGLDAMADRAFAQADADYEARADIAWNFELMAEAGRDPQVAEIVRQFFAHTVDTLTEIFRRGQAAGQVDPDLDPRAAALVLAGAFDGLGEWLWFMDNETRAGARRLFKEMAEGLLRGRLGSGRLGSGRRVAPPMTRSGGED